MLLILMRYNLIIFLIFGKNEIKILFIIQLFYYSYINAIYYVSYFNAIYYFINFIFILIRINYLNLTI